MIPPNSLLKKSDSPHYYYSYQPEEELSCILEPDENKSNKPENLKKKTAKQDMSYPNLGQVFRETSGFERSEHNWAKYWPIKLSCKDLAKLYRIR